MKLNEFNDTLVVNRELDHYWFHNTGCQYPLVCPKGTKVKFKSILRNYVGTWFEVEYEGKIYYGFPKDFDGNVLVDKKVYSYFDAPRCRLVHKVYYTDRNNQKYILTENCELEAIYES